MTLKYNLYLYLCYFWSTIMFGYLFGNYVVLKYIQIFVWYIMWHPNIFGYLFLSVLWYLLITDWYQKKDFLHSAPIRIFPLSVFSYAYSYWCAIHMLFHIQDTCVSSRQCEFSCGDPLHSFHPSPCFDKECRSSPCSFFTWSCIMETKSSMFYPQAIRTTLHWQRINWTELKHYYLYVQTFTSFIAQEFEPFNYSLACPETRRSIFVDDRSSPLAKSPYLSQLTLHGQNFWTKYLILKSN